MKPRFDLLKAIMAVMILATLAAGGYGAYQWRRMGGLKRDVDRQLKLLKDAQTMARSDSLLKLIRVVKEKSETDDGQHQGLPSYLHLKAANMKLSPEIKPLGDQIDGGVREESVRLTFSGLAVRDLVRYLVDLVNGWPGLKIKALRMEQYNDGTRRWGNIIVEVAYYNRV